ncbi:hypothetical protein EG329_011712 [Mollisiaceae sp. DMI_Dod_QoI]|nr:hypothetical protein EG329_011712 [Helotiales sp. DMI_Dod_QoI]
MAVESRCFGSYKPHDDEHQLLPDVNDGDMKRREETLSTSRFGKSKTKEQEQVDKDYFLLYEEDMVHKKLCNYSELDVHWIIKDKILFLQRKRTSHQKSNDDEADQPAAKKRRSASGTDIGIPGITVETPVEATASLVIA